MPRRGLERARPRPPSASARAPIGTDRRRRLKRAPPLPPPLSSQHAHTHTKRGYYRARRRPLSLSNTTQQHTTNTKTPEAPSLFTAPSLSLSPSTHAQQQTRRDVQSRRPARPTVEARGRRSGEKSSANRAPQRGREREFSPLSQVSGHSTARALTPFFTPETRAYTYPPHRRSPLRAPAGVPSSSSPPARPAKLAGEQEEEQEQEQPEEEEGGGAQAPRPQPARSRTTRPRAGRRATRAGAWFAARDDGEAVMGGGAREERHLVFARAPVARLFSCPALKRAVTSAT
jgi:hypothetical protein